MYAALGESSGAVSLAVHTRSKLATDVLGAGNAFCDQPPSQAGNVWRCHAGTARGRAFNLLRRAPTHSCGKDPFAGDAAEPFTLSLVPPGADTVTPTPVLESKAPSVVKYEAVSALMVTSESGHWLAPPSRAVVLATAITSGKTCRYRQS